MRCMQQAMSTVKTPIDYINATAPPPGGRSGRLGAVRRSSATRVPFIQLDQVDHRGTRWAAAGVQEAIYSLLMLQNDFLAASAHIETLDPAAEGPRSCASAATVASTP